LKIVILTQYFYPEIGAAPIRFYEIAQDLRRRGYEVTVVTTFPSHRMKGIPKEYRNKFFIKEKMGRFEVLRVWSYPSQEKKFFKRLLTYFSFVLTSLFGLIQAGEYDLIIVHSPPLFTGISALMINFIKKTPFVFSVSDLWPQVVVDLGKVKNKLVIKASEWLEQLIYKKAWKIIAVSEGIHRAIVDKGIPEEKVTYLPNGVNVEVFSPRKKKKELVEKYNLENRRTFLYAGNFGYAFDVQSILKAAQILEKKGENISFLLVGNGPEKSELMRKAREMNLNNVHFIEPQPVDVISDYYALSTATLVPMKKSKFPERHKPARLYASMSCKKPIIYCGNGEPVKMINEAKCGIVVEPENPWSLVEAILKLSRNPKLAEKLGENGREYVLKHYTWNYLISRWLNEVGLPQRLEG
jgi:glycosyltransferase involved in cell wall biosynthesis